MTLYSLWSKASKSISSITFYDNQNVYLGSGSGFIIEGKLVTNNHVFKTPRAAAYVTVTFVKEDGFTVYAFKRFDLAEFNQRLLAGDDEANWDYAILRMDDAEFKSIPSLILAENQEIKIGQQIAFMGFHFDKSNLALHEGIISSQFHRGTVKYIQLDASVNHGNSGCPLFDLDKGEVIGIITRKQTGLSEQFDKLMESFERNAAVLTQPRQAVIKIGGIDPVQILGITQLQMKDISKEIKRSANVGIGYAYQLDRILEALHRLRL